MTTKHRAILVDTTEGGTNAVRELIPEQVWFRISRELTRTEHLLSRVIRLHVFSHHTDSFYSLEQWVAALKEYSDLVEEQGSARLSVDHYQTPWHYENDEMELENSVLSFGGYP